MSRTFQVKNMKFCQMIRSVWKMISKQFWSTLYLKMLGLTAGYPPSPVTWLSPAYPDYGYQLDFKLVPKLYPTISLWGSPFVDHCYVVQRSTSLYVDCSTLFTIRSLPYVDRNYLISVRTFGQYNILYYISAISASLMPKS